MELCPSLLRESNQLLLGYGSSPDETPPRHKHYPILLTVVLCRGFLDGQTHFGRARLLGGRLLRGCGLLPPLRPGHRLGLLGLFRSSVLDWQDSAWGGSGEKREVICASRHDFTLISTHKDTRTYVHQPNNLPRRVRGSDLLHRRCILRHGPSLHPPHRRSIKRADRSGAARESQGGYGERCVRGASVEKARECGGRSERSAGDVRADEAQG